MSAAGDIGLCGKVSMGLYGEILENSCDFSPAPTHTVERQHFVELGAFELICAFYSGRPWESSRKLYCRLAKMDLLVQIAD